MVLVLPPERNKASSKIIHIKFLKSFVHKLFKISPALSDTKHNEMALLEAAASDPGTGNEMNFTWLISGTKTLFFKEGEVGIGVDTPTSGAHDPFCE